jgi:type IV secretory pathway ATPase VirB11/archaellum biosynthesis ATPase
MEFGKLIDQIKLYLAQLKFCETCKKKLERLKSLADDPVKFYYAFDELKVCNACANQNVKALGELYNILQSSRIIKEAIKAENAKEFYDKIFPARLVPSLITSEIGRVPPSTKKLEEYRNNDVRVEIYASKGRPDNFYFVRYPEFSLDSRQLKLLQEAFKIICDARLSETRHSEVRKEIKKIAEEFLISNAKSKLSEAERQMLINIILRHTIGYGVLEPLLGDEMLQDIYVDSGSRLVHVVHSRYGECLTNIMLSNADIEKLATRLRATSGRPFDASSPILHTELQDFGVRVAAITEPSTYRGIGFAFRRRKSTPWTLPEFIKHDMINPLAAGLMSFFLDGNASILIVGPRGSGKTSFLTSLILEIPQNNRIIVIEDTPEVPVDALREIGYKIEHLRTEAFAKGYELSAEDALRTSLRLGESILILGEVRGPEAKALFEAMRIGAVGNVVMGTIHGSGPYDVWDRITNDLGVPSTSFKATDIIVTTGIVRHGNETLRHRRVLSITEVRKNWRDEPIFFDIAKYDRTRDALVFNDLKKSETIAKIAAMKGFSIKGAIADINARTYVKEKLLKASKTYPEILHSRHIVAANSAFIRLSSEKNFKKKFDEWFKEYQSTLQ